MYTYESTATIPSEYVYVSSTGGVVYYTVTNS